METEIGKYTWRQLERINEPERNKRGHGKRGVLIYKTKHL